MLQEWKKEENDFVALYFYTPLCGTCKVGERMLEVVQVALPEVKIYKVNINLHVEWAHEWKIESVPCLVVVKGGKVVEKRYAMQSVGHLYELLKEKLG
ncbi:thioredoxin family protein [Ammoniphilus sp. CFH 90114]|uniref:thioredoxin family protein n=1 Tax=Ammoniphilus sp. CFH 90114 TaxID=2493665 RepID=UPI00100FAF97|nr:thioredoxin family protein [Ammoniphilus sp. CFH 90114]RXT04115.1 thioredoxin [Ammoniphilus sp. CFH 90114]